MRDLTFSGVLRWRCGDGLRWPRRIVDVGLVCLLTCTLLIGCSSKKAGTTPPPDVPESDAASSAEAESNDSAQAVELATETPESTATDSDAKAQTTLEQSAGGGTDADSAAKPDSGIPSYWANASWTRKRLVALADSGPVVLDLRVSVGGQSLAEASDAMAGAIWRELFDSPGDSDTDMPSEESASNVESGPLQWEEVLNHPVVKSGWLGNLVPDDEQEDQIFSMYDEGQDRKVTLAEFQNFVSRGLSRRAALQVSDTGAESAADMGSSPWGDIDQNEDYSVDHDERLKVAQAVEKYDFNADAIVSLQEVRQPEPSQADGGMQYSTMLDVSTLYIADGLFDEDPNKRLEENRALADRVLNHYTYLEGIERAQWSSWSDDRWNELDSNEDGLLKGAELKAMGEQDPECYLSIFLPSVQSMVEDADADAEEAMDGEGMETMPEAKSQPHAQVLALTAASRQDQQQVAPGWVSASDGGRLAIGGVVLQVLVDDDYGAANASLLRQRFEMALSNEQFENFASNQLQLEEGGFGLIDEDEDGKLSDAEFRRVWRWLTVRQSARAIGRWMTTEHPWFQLLDLSGDQKLSQKELADAADTIAGLDGDADGSVAPNELPLLVRFELNRTDSRLNFGALGLPQTEQAERPSDWFGAMDTNQDGFLSKLEFLGENDDFSALDADKDGFIARKEVY